METFLPILLFILGLFLVPFVALLIIVVFLLLLAAIIFGAVFLFNRLFR